ncbi:MAG: fumarate hydratase [Mucilaginibacter sp.]
MQHRPAFLLSAFSFALLAFTFASCTLNPDLQGKGEAYLQGEWRQDSVPMQKKLTEYSLYNISFSCDSFFMQINSFSKVNNGADKCTASGHWTEYVKGAYQQHGDTLHVRGQFCNANFSLKAEGGCFRSGIYEETFTVKKNRDSLVSLTGSSVIPIDLHLKKRATCTQKPL